MDFARKILLNYGWKEGDGLGKNNNGIATPLRATLKFDNAGFGANQAASDFNNHWWERVFNEAATNVNITQEGEQLKMVLKDDEGGVEISTKCYSTKKLKKLKKKQEGGGMKSSYENFWQAATLTNLGTEVENPQKIDSNDIEVSKVKVLTDEELFKACGGRTAHKGARHGLKLSGKLSRIEQQETELLSKMMAKRKGLIEGYQVGTKSLKTEDTLELCLKQKNEKKKNKIRVEVPFCGIDPDEGNKLNKKKRKLCDLECPDDVYANHESRAIEIKMKKKKRVSEEKDERTTLKRKKKKNS